MQLVTAHAKVRVSVQNQKLSKLVPVKSGVGQNIAMHALPTARCFFLSVHLPDLFSFLCSTFLFTCFALRLANAGPVWTHRIKWVTLLIVRGNQHWFLSLVPLECQSGSQTLVCYNSEAYTCDPLNCFEMFISKHA